MEALILGLTLGFSAGINPGPLTLLVMQQTLGQGLRAGLLASTAPVLTDALVVLLALGLARGLPTGFHLWINLVGGAVLIYLGLKGFLKREAVGQTVSLTHGLRDAILLNLTNPNAYLFWFTVGLTQLKRPLPEPWFFILGFYPGIVGSKAAIALLTARFRGLPWLRPVARWSHLLLALIGVYLLFRASRP
jgi:threonine/homoserine/homoserine lactone efflux protein